MATNTKLKTYALGGALALSALLASCKNKNNDEQVVAQKPQTELKQTTILSNKPKQKTAEEIRREYCNDVRDSIATANGADELREQLNSKREEWEDGSNIRDLEFPYSLGTTMNREVCDAGSKIIDGAYDKIVTGLAKYSVSLNGAISQDSAGFSIRKGVLDKWNSYADKWNMCFTGLESNDYDADYDWNTLTRALDTVIAASDYGAGQKNNMRAMVRGVIDNAKQELIASRKSIESKYADYYSFVDKNHVGLSYGGEGSEYYGYEDMNDEWFNPKYLIIRRRSAAYDSKLKVDFFGDADTEYRLNSLGNGRWQVVKKAKDGMVSTTHVFNDPKEIEIDTVRRNEPQKVGDYEFGYTPGQNYGVHVYSTEVIDVQRRKKDWTIKLPADVQHTVDSLNREAQEKRELSERLWKIENTADSIARVMTEKKFGFNR